MRLSSKRTLRSLGVALAALFILLALSLYLLSSLDIRQDAAQRRGTLTSAESTSEGSDDGFRRSHLTLRSSGGLVVECRVMMPADPPGPVPAFIMLGGKATGKHAVDYVVDIRNAVVVAVDYPYEPRPSYSALDVARDLPLLRRALLDMPPSILLVVDHLSTLPLVDTSRIVVTGYSFGAPFVPVSMSLDKRIDAGVMAYGGGNIARLIYHNVRLYEGEAFSRFVGWASAVLLRPIEPTRYVADVAPRPLLMINGMHDERIPTSHVDAVYEQAREPKRMVWIPSGHVHPTNEELTRTIVKEMKRVMFEWGILRDGEN